MPHGKSVCLQLNLRLLKKAPEAQVFKSYRFLTDCQELKWSSQSGKVGGNSTFAPNCQPPQSCFPCMSNEKTPGSPIWGEEQKEAKRQKWTFLSFLIPCSSPWSFTHSKNMLLVSGRYGTLI